MLKSPLYVFPTNEHQCDGIAISNDGTQLALALTHPHYGLNKLEIRSGSHSDFYPIRTVHEFKSASQSSYEYSKVSFPSFAPFHLDTVGCLVNSQKLVVCGDSNRIRTYGFPFDAEHDMLEVEDIDSCVDNYAFISDKTKDTARILVVMDHGYVFLLDVNPEHRPRIAGKLKLRERGKRLCRLATHPQTLHAAIGYGDTVDFLDMKSEDLVVKNTLHLDSPAPRRKMRSVFLDFDSYDTSDLLVGAECYESGHLLVYTHASKDPRESLILPNNDIPVAGSWIPGSSHCIAAYTNTSSVYMWDLRAPRAETPTIVAECEDHGERDRSLAHSSIRWGKYNDSEENAKNTFLFMGLNLGLHIRPTFVPVCIT
jgi:hypothetical protein